MIEPQKGQSADCMDCLMVSLTSCISTPSKFRCVLLPGSYTWSQSEPLIFSRLDYWLISNSLSDNVSEVDMISSIKTDHSAIVIEFQDVDENVKGPGFWKLNYTHLNDKQYVNELNCLLPTWLEEGKKDLSDPRSVWDWVKCNVKKYSRSYSMNKCKHQKIEEQQLNNQFQEATSAYQDSPTQENLSALNVLKEKTEQLFEKKVEGIIVRSRARWHEYGEKIRNIFFNLEKRNHTRKYIRKLRLSGVITTDPFEILEAERFYENLYKSRRNSFEENDQLCFEDLPIPTLSPETTHLVQLLVEKNFKQRLKKIKNTINLWKSRELSIHGMVNIIKTLLLPKMIYVRQVR